MGVQKVAVMYRQLVLKYFLNKLSIKSSSNYFENISMKLSKFNVKKTN